jgi:hypothetical protein
MHIEIIKHPIKPFQVRVVDAKARMTRMFTYPMIESRSKGREGLDRRLRQLPGSQD